MTEEDKIELMRIRKQRYNALSYEQKINFSMIAYNSCMTDRKFHMAISHLSKAIKLLFEKIDKRHS